MGRPLSDALQQCCDLMRGTPVLALPLLSEVCECACILIPLNGCVRTHTFKGIRIHIFGNFFLCLHLYLLHLVTETHHIVWISNRDVFMSGKRSLIPYLQTLYIISVAILGPLPPRAATVDGGGGGGGDK